MVVFVLLFTKMTTKTTYCAQLEDAVQSSLVQVRGALEQIALDGPSDEAHILE